MDVYETRFSVYGLTGLSQFEFIFFKSVVLV